MMRAEPSSLGMNDDQGGIPGSRRMLDEPCLKKLIEHGIHLLLHQEVDAIGAGRHRLRTGGNGSSERYHVVGVKADF